MSTVLSPKPVIVDEEPVLDPTPLLSSASSSSSSDQGPSVEPEPEAVPILTADGHICYVCRRRLGSAEMLQKHEELSALHQKNLRLAKQVSVRRRQELRQDVVRLRYGDPGDLSQLETELGAVQESIEENNRTQVSASVHSDVGSFSIDITGLSWMGNKPSNEDRMLLRMNLGDHFAGVLVADGHCGDICADYLVTHLSNNIRAHLTAQTVDAVQTAITEGFRKTDSDFMDHAVAHQIPAGSTAVVAIFFIDHTNPETLSCVMGHVGDSRGLVSAAPDRSVVRVTEDHKPDRPDEHIRLAAAGGHVVDVGGVWRVFTPSVVSIGGRSLQWGLAVSRAFGDLALKRPAVIVSAEPEVSDSVLLRDGAVVVIACDGIFDVMTDEDTMLAAKSGGPGAVLRAAYGKLSDDNLSAVVCTVTQRHKAHDPATNELRRRGSAIEPTMKKRRHRDEDEHDEDELSEMTVHRRSSEAPELITPSQQC